MKIKLLFFLAILVSLEKVSAQKLLLQDVVHEVGCIVDVFVDDGNIYLGLTDNTIQIYEDSMWSDEIELLSGFSPLGGITRDDSGVIWYAGGNGLFSYENGNIVHYDESNSDIPTDNFRSVESYMDTLWILENGTDLVKKVGEQFEVVPVFSGAFDFLHLSELTPDGRLVVTSSSKLAIVQGQQVEILSLNGRITDLFLESDGNILITSSRSISRLNTETNEIEEIISNSTFEFEKSGIDSEGNIYSLLDNFEFVVIDSSGMECIIKRSTIEESNFEEFFNFDDTTLMSFGLNINGSEGTCYVITSLNGTALDSDEDGFSVLVDCDDDNFLVYPGAEEIPNNGIDENCDGMDLTTGVHDLSNAVVKIYPNPVRDLLRIDVEGSLEFNISIFDHTGKEVLTADNRVGIDVRSLREGIYFLKLEDQRTTQSIVEKILIRN